MDEFDEDDDDGYHRRAPAVMSRRRADSSDSDGDAPRSQPVMNSSMFGEAPAPDIFGGGGFFEDEPAEISRGFPASSSSGSRQRLQPPASAPSSFDAFAASGTGASSSSAGITKNARFSDSAVEVGRPDAPSGRSKSPSEQERNRPLNVRRLSTPQQRVEDKGRQRIGDLAIEEEEDEELELKRAEGGFGEVQEDFDVMADAQLFSEIPDDCLMGEAAVPTHSPTERISFSRVSFNRESFAERASFDRVSLKRISHQKIIDPHSAHWAEYEDRNSFGDTTTDQVLGSIFEIEGDTSGAFFDTDIPVEAVTQGSDDRPDSFAAIVAAAAASARPGLNRPQAGNGLSSWASSGAAASAGSTGATCVQKDGITPNVELPGVRRSREGAAVSSDLAMLCELDPLLEEAAEEPLSPAFAPPPREAPGKVSAPAPGASALTGSSGSLSKPPSSPLESSAPLLGALRNTSFDGGGLFEEEPQPCKPPASTPVAAAASAQTPLRGLSAKMRASGLGGTSALGLGLGASSSGSSGGRPPADDASDPFGLGARSVWSSSPAGDLGFGLDGAGSSSRRAGIGVFGALASERRTTGQMPVRRMALDEDVAPPILVPSRSEHSLRTTARATAASCAQQYAGGALGFASPAALQPPTSDNPLPPPRTPDGRPTAPAVPPLDSMLQSRGATTALDSIRAAQRRVTF